MKKVLICFSVAMLVAACAIPTEENYQKVLNFWKGADADLLVLNWGPPDSSHELSDGRKVLQYTYSKTTITGGDTYTVPRTTYGSGSIYGDYGRIGSYSGTSTAYVTETTPISTTERNCTTRFIVSKDNIIQSWSYEGNWCVAFDFPTYTQEPATDLTLEKLRAESGAFTLPEGVVVLSEEELRAEIVGSTLNGVYANGISWIEWYNPNGEIRGFLGRENYTGKWSIVGPVMCYDYTIRGMPIGVCLTLSLDGDQINFHTNEGTLWPDLLPGTLTEGNPQGL